MMLLAVLGGLLVASGTDAPNPAANDYPSEEDVGPDPGAYVGQQVTVSGRVVDTDPLRVAAEYGTGGTYTVTVTDVDRSPAEGDYLSAFGTLEDGSTLSAERVIVREHWELWYMYLVSFVAGLWVLTRTVRRWRFDADELAFVPREEPIGFGGDGVA